ncbi:MAG: hypothetical protein QW219_02175 [Fervidicoccaceae archaeon]
MRSRRCRYDYAQVIRTVLEHPLLYRVCEVIFSSDRPLHSSEVGKQLGIGQGYAYNLLKKLERWGIVEPLRDPANGKTMFRPSGRKVAQMLSEELRKRRVGELMVIVGGEEEDQGTG